jgi:hypothetical protein
MRYRYLALAAVSSIFVWTSLVAQPQEEGIASEPSQRAPREQGRYSKGLARFLESLSPETRERFIAAREKALQDPKLQQLRQAAESAKREFLKAMRAKMLEIDPGLAEIIRKRAGEHKSWKDWKGSHSSPGNLTEDELDKLLSVRQKAKSDLAVQAAEKKKEQATTPEERNAASENYRKAMHDAMLKADPSIESLLEKIAAKPPSSPNSADVQTDRLMTKEPQPQ